MKKATWLRQAFLVVAAIPAGAVLGFICGAAIILATDLFNSLVYSRPQTLHLWFFFEFEWKLAAYFGAPEGAMLFPLIYLVFLRDLDFRQIIRPCLCLSVGAVTAGILASIGLQSFMAIPVVAGIGASVAIGFVFRKQATNVKKFIRLMILGPVLLIAVAIISTPLIWIFGVKWSMWRIKQVEDKLKSASVYQVAGTNLAIMCQSIQFLDLHEQISGALWPSPIAQIKDDAWGTVDVNHAFVEFGGGMYHYGYNLRRDEDSSNAATNFWELFYHSESSPDKPLCRFSLPMGALLSKEMFVSNALSEFSRRLRNDRRNLITHKCRIRFLLEQNPPGVREACLDAIQAEPGHWWPHLTLALWDAGRGQFREASKTLEEFVTREPSYSRYIYLAWFYQTMNHPTEAAAAIEKAINCPIADLRDDETNSEFRGYSVGVSAYRSGKYNLVIKLCDRLLPIRENGDFAKAGLSALRNAAQAGVDGKADNFQPGEGLSNFNPYGEVELNWLLGR